MNTTTAMRRSIMEQNLSFSDRQIRFVIGATLIAATLIVAPDTMGLWNSVALLSSILFITTAIVGWDPVYALAKKSEYVEGEEDIQQRSWTCPNLGAIDRAVRFGIGSILIASLLTMNMMHADMVLTLFAIPLILTAITAWDPVYAMLRINSFASRVDVEVAEPDASESILGECFILPQRKMATLSYSRAA